MPKYMSCLLALAVAVSSALLATPSQAQTATESNRNITSSPESSISTVNTTSNSSNLEGLKKKKTTNISQSQPEVSEKAERERNWVYSRIGFGLKQ
ncbi:MAG: hypothetical protein AAFW70_06625 [Cyanobacteria bacterium J06635_10]